MKNIKALLQNTRGSTHVVIGFMTIMLFCVLLYVGLFVFIRPAAETILDALRALTNAIK